MENGKEIEQLTLLDVDPDWKKEWEGMPEFNSSENSKFHEITVSFKSKSDMENFGKLVNQKITTQTNWIYYPKLEYKTRKDTMYISEDIDKNEP